MDSESTLIEYKIQLEQVELALKTDPDNDQLQKLKEDLEEIIVLTKELISEEDGGDTSAASANNNAATSSKNRGGAFNLNRPINWKSGDKCQAIWRADGKHYPAVLDQILEDGTCTVVFDGYKTNELVQIGQLMPRSKDDSSASSLTPGSKLTIGGHKKAFTKKELETKLREAKKKKREKYAVKVKAMEDLSEKEKNKWKNFNTKLSGKTWKGVVKKNKFETPENHENKIGVGTNSLTNRVIAPDGTILSGANHSSASSAAAALQSASGGKATPAGGRHVSQSYKTSVP